MLAKNKIIHKYIFITGPHAVGKTTLGNQFLKMNFQVFDLGPMLRAIYKQRAEKGETLKDWILKGEKLNKHFTDDILVNEINKRLNKTKKKAYNVLFVGSRSFAGISYIKRNVFPRPDEIKIIYIDAPFNVLKKRYENREKLSNVSEDFLKTLLAEDDKIGLKSIFAKADYILDGTKPSNNLVLETIEIINGKI